MALNFLGLGFSFGAKDTGLGSFLDGVDAQFQQITDTLKGLYDVADKAPDMALGAPDAGAAMAGAAEAAAGLGAAGDAAGAVAGISEAAEAASVAGDAMSALGGAGKSGGKMLSGGAFKAVGALGRVAGAAGIAGMAIGPMVSGFGEAVNAVQSFGESVAMGLPRMVQRGMDGISRMNEGINLTNSLEAEAQGLSVSARALGANMGYTGEELSNFAGRATSMAMALNMGSDATGKAIRAFDEAGTELRALGFDGARDVARFTEAFGVDADLLRNTSMQMTREFGMTTEQVSQLFSSTVAYGQASGDVAGALQGVETTMAHMRAEAALMGSELDSADLLHHAQSAQALATGLFQVGQNSGQTLEASQSLAESLLESRTEFQNMFSGTQDDLPAFATQLATTTGDVSAAFEAMSQGPEEFVSGMVDLVSGAEDAEEAGKFIEFFRARMGEAVGPEQANQLVNFFRNATPEITDMMEATAHATRNLGDMGREAHRTGRTMQESFDRAIEGASTALRSVTRQDTARFVRDTGREMRELGSAFREIGQQEGPMGAIVQAMSRTAQMGQLGLVPERFRTTAVMANQIHENMKPLIASMTSFGGLVDMAATQAILFGTRVAQNMDDAREKMGETATEAEVLRAAFDLTAGEFEAEWISAIDSFETYFTMFVEGFAGIDWATLFTPSDEDTAEGATGAMGSVQRIIQRIRDMDWSGIYDGLVTGTTRLWALLEPHMLKVWSDFNEWIVPQLTSVWDDVVKAWDDWWAANWTTVAGGLAAVFTGIFIVAFAAAFAALGVVILASFITAFLLPFVAVTALLIGAWELFGEDLMESTEGLGDWFGETWEGLGQGFEDTWNGLGTWWDEEFIGGMTSSWDGMWIGAQNRVTGAIQWFQQAFPRITAGFSRLTAATSRLWDVMWNLMGQRVETAKAQMGLVWEGMRDQAMSVFSGIGEFFSGIWEGIVEAVGSVAEGIGNVWNLISENIEAALNRISEALTPLRETIDTVGGFFTQMWEGVEGVIEGIVENISGLFDELSGAGLGALSAIIEAAAEHFARSMNTYIAHDVDKSSDEFERLSTAGTSAIESVLGLAEDGFGQSMHTMIEEGFGADVQAVAEIVSDPGVAARRESLLNEGGGLLEATHYPDWYMNDFKRLYDTRATEMIQAVREISVSRPEVPRGGRGGRVRGLGGASGQARGLPQGGSPSGTRA